MALKRRQAVTDARIHIRTEKARLRFRLRGFGALLIAAVTAACADAPSIAGPDYELLTPTMSSSVDASFSFHDGGDYSVDHSSEGDHACLPVIPRGSLPFWLNINNVGITKFTASGPFERIRILSSSSAEYRMSDGVAQSDNGDWYAYGTVTLSCSKVPPIPLFHTHIGKIIAFNGTVRGVADVTCYGDDGDDDEPPIYMESVREGGDQRWADMGSTGAQQPAYDVTVQNSTCGSSGENGGGGTMTCITVRVDRYWYYPSTGEFEYRYTYYDEYCYYQS